MEEAVPIVLYRLFDRQGQLLYVGITVSPGHRFTHHKAMKSWWPDVDPARTTLTLHASREEAAEAEVAAIQAEKPVHNIVAAEGRTWGRPVTVLTQEQEQVLDEVVQRARQTEELRRRLWAEVELARDAGVPDMVLCEKAGISRATLNRRLGSRSAPKRSAA